MAEVLRSLGAQLAECEGLVAALEAQGAQQRARAELGDSRLRGLGFGHEGSRLAVVAAGEDRALSTALLHASSGSAGYTLVDDLAGRWMSERARLEGLRQRRRELIGQ